ncbi:MAG TPA: GGDEF domain-containing protein [Pyrinomonadaceae bacterium]
MNVNKNAPESVSGRFRTGQIALGLFGLVAPILTFFLAVSTLPDSAKVIVLVTLAFVYSVVCYWSFTKSQTHDRQTDLGESHSSSAELDENLRAIGETSEFFGTSLKPGDMFRLVSNRITHVFPFANSALFVASESGDTLFVAQADGPNEAALRKVELPVEKGLAGMSWMSGEIETDLELQLERAAVPGEAITGSRSAVAIPLLHANQAFAVLVLYTASRITDETNLQNVLRAIGERVAPLFLSSIAFERSVANALTDPLTRLPNERAFYMVLENQLAESHRFRTERPLTVLTIDIKNFTEANQSFGFNTGDRMLAFAAEHLASQLRKMDFLSRSANDEFLVILPTATPKFAEDIVQRIRERFASEIFSASETDDIKVWLNFGWATFWQDGETAEQLLQNARIRKQQAKAEEPTKVLWFPKEYVN